MDLLTPLSFLKLLFLTFHFFFSGYDIEKIESVLTDSKFRDLYNQANEDGGLVCLMLRAGTDSMNLTSNKPVTSMEDLKGLKIPHRSGGEPDGGLECIGCQPDSHGFQ